MSQTENMQDRIRQHPALSLVGMPLSQILGKHQNDFNQFLLGDLELYELRAIRAALPQFRRDQRRQAEFTDSLELKIEELSKTPHHSNSRKTRTPLKKLGRSSGPQHKLQKSPTPSMASLADELNKRRKT